MYEELLPYWKDLCRRIHTGKVDPTAIPRSDPWVQEVYVKRGMRWRWVASEYEDILVHDIMLFTWEQGIAE